MNCTKPFFPISNSCKNEDLGKREMNGLKSCGAESIPMNDREWWGTWNALISIKGRKKGQLQFLSRSRVNLQRFFSWMHYPIWDSQQNPLENEWSTYWATYHSLYHPMVLLISGTFWYNHCSSWCVNTCWHLNFSLAIIVFLGSILWGIQFLLCLDVINWYYSLLPHVVCLLCSCFFVKVVYEALVFMLAISSRWSWKTLKSLTLSSLWTINFYCYITFSLSWYCQLNDLLWNI